MGQLGSRPLPMLTWPIRRYGAAPASLNYDNLSTIYFLDPEVAACGLGEQEAQERQTGLKEGLQRGMLPSRRRREKE